MNVESVLLRIDHLAGGRHADHTISPAMRKDPRTHRVFVAITWLLVIELVLGVGALAVPVLLHLRGTDVRFIVWMRLIVVLGMTTTLAAEVVQQDLSGRGPGDRSHPRALPALDGHRTDLLQPHPARYCRVPVVRSHA